MYGRAGRIDLHMHSSVSDGTDKTVKLGETGLTRGSRPERLRLFIDNFI